MKKLFFLCCISLVCIYGCNDDSDKYFSNFLKSKEAILGSERGTITVEGWEKFKLVQAKEIVNQDTIYTVDEINGTDYQGRWYHVKVDEKRMTIDCDKNETGNKRVVSLLFQGSGNSFDWFSLTQSE